MRQPATPIYTGNQPALITPHTTTLVNPIRCQAISISQALVTKQAKPIKRPRLNIPRLQINTGTVKLKEDRLHFVVFTAPAGVTTAQYLAIPRCPKCNDVTIHDSPVGGQVLRVHTNLSRNTSTGLKLIVKPNDAYISG